MVGEIRCIAFASNRIPENWMLCDGRELPTNTSYSSLYSVIGKTFGGNSNMFRLPNLNDSVIMHSNGVIGTSMNYTIPAISSNTTTVILDELFNIQNNIIDPNA